MQHARSILKLWPHLGPERVVWDLQNGGQVQISTSTVKRLKRKMHEALHPVPPPPLPPVWRFYERQHPHSLWHGDYMKKIRLADGSGRTAFQLTLGWSEQRYQKFHRTSLWLVISTGYTIGHCRVCLISIEICEDYILRNSL
jgi:hypothetical protein